MRRRIFTLATAVSLLLLVATLVLWTRSYGRTIFIACYSRPFDGSALHTRMLEIKDGRLLLIRNVWWRGGPTSRRFEVHDLPRTRYDDGWDVAGTMLGFGFFFERTAPNVTDIACAPCWFITALLLLLALFIRSKSGQKPDPQSCPVCDYNLTGNTSGVCPECGTPIPQKAEVAA